MAEPAWYLEGFESVNRNILRVALTGFPFIVGRTADCDLSLDSLRVSQQHAEFFTQDNELWLRDRESTNGTFVNGQRLQSQQLLQPGDIVHFADLEFRLGERQLASQENMYAETVPVTKGDLEGGKYREFRAMLAAKNVQVLFQPIINLRDSSVLGYECLGRGVLDDKLMMATDLFLMADILGLSAELSRLLRVHGASAAANLPTDVKIFLNTHPTELNDQETLLTSLLNLRQHHPKRTFVLEVHESAVTDAVNLQILRDRLVELDIEVAFDDFGVGQARLIELSDAAPSFLKFDVSLIHNIHRASKKRRDVLKTLVQLALDMDVVTIAEGIEKEEEVRVCRDLGFEYGQGFYFGQPIEVNELLAQ